MLTCTASKHYTKLYQFITQQCLDSVGWATARNPDCKISCFTNPQSFSLGGLWQTVSNAQPGVISGKYAALTEMEKLLYQFITPEDNIFQ